MLQSIHFLKHLDRGGVEIIPAVIGSKDGLDWAGQSQGFQVIKGLFSHPKQFSSSHSPL